MKDDTEIALTATSELATNNTYHLEQNGGGTNIGVAQNVDMRTTQIYMPIQGQVPPGINQAYQPPFTINTEFFNLFVIANESYDQNYFLLDLDRALTTTYGTNDDIHNRLATFTEEAISEIKTYPAIFAGENYRYCPPNIPDPGIQYAYYGFITDVKVQGNGKIRVYYQLMPMCYIPQNVLNSMLDELDLNGSSKVNELDKTHWAIKHINLIEEMRLKGISLFAPTI